MKDFDVTLGQISYYLIRVKAESRKEAIAKSKQEAEEFSLIPIECSEYEAYDVEENNDR